MHLPSGRDPPRDPAVRRASRRRLPSNRACDPGWLRLLAEGPASVPWIDGASSRRQSGFRRAELTPRRTTASLRSGAGRADQSAKTRAARYRVAWIGAVSPTLLLLTGAAQARSRATRGLDFVPCGICPAQRDTRLHARSGTSAWPNVQDPPRTTETWVPRFEFGHIQPRSPTTTGKTEVPPDAAPRRRAIVLVTLDHALAISRVPQPSVALKCDRDPLPLPTDLCPKFFLQSISNIYRGSIDDSSPIPLEDGRSC